LGITDIRNGEQVKELTAQPGPRPQQNGWRRSAIAPVRASTKAVMARQPSGSKYRLGDTATAGIALGASFNPALARQPGGMLAREARSRNFNVQLAGRINLARSRSRSSPRPLGY